ncbi:MAG: biopolymer transporter ExbD [Pirellulales bacterium]
MPIRFRCPFCDQRLSAPSKVEGRQIKCPRCTAPIDVPESAVGRGRSGKGPPKNPLLRKVETRVMGGAVSLPVQDAGEADESQPMLRTSRTARDGELDMTPMVDVTFLLLIFFMITAAYALQMALEVPASEERDAAAPSRTLHDFEEDSIVVRVDGDNFFWIGAPGWQQEREAPSTQEMLIQLRDARENGAAGGGTGPARMLVLASGDATHEKVVDALDAGTAVGMEDVRLATFEEGEL